MMEVDKKKTRTDEAWVRLYARFETDCLLPADAEHAPAMHRRLYLKWGSVAAAVIAGIVCFAAWWAVPEQGGDSRSLLTEENREKPTLVKTLEDGSVVYLAQESTLKYPEHFAEDKREVNLQGEAFFDVAKKPEQAFTIETARVRVEVLGTAFNVRSNEGLPLQLVREAREGEGAAETRGTDGLCRGGRNGYLAGGQSARQRDGESGAL